MAAVSTIQLVVDESGAAVGFAKLKASGTAAVMSIDTAAKATQTELGVMGAAGAAAGDKMGAGFQKARGHALSNLDAVRLMRDDLGIHVPRAMEKLIASTEAFQAVSSVAFGAFAFVGVVELLDVIGTKIKGLAQDWMGFGKAAQEGLKAMIDANNQIILNPSNFDAGQRRLADLNKQAAELGARKQWMKDIDQHRHLSHSSTRAEKYTYDPGWAPGAKPENNPLTSDEERTLAELTKDGGLIAQLGAKQAADKKRLDDEDRKRSDDLFESQLKGVAKLKAAREYAFRDVDAKQFPGILNAMPDATHEQIMRATKGQAPDPNATITPEEANRQRSAADAKYTQDLKQYNEEQAKSYRELEDRKRAFADETRKMEQAAMLSSLDGSARVYAQEKYDIENLSDLRRSRHEEDAKFDQAYTDRKVAIEKRADSEINRSMESYRNSARESHNALGISTSSGYGAIGAEMKKQTDDARASYNRMVDGMAADDVRRVEAAQILQMRLNDIDTEGDYKAEEIHRRALDETQGIEERAMSVRSGATKKGLTGIFQQEQDAVNRIEAEYEKQTRKLQEELDRQEISERDAADRRSAIEDQRNAEIAAAQRSSHDKLAGELESAFKDPQRTIQESMQHMMFSIIADWVMQLHIFKKLFGDSFPGAAPGAHGGPAGALGAATGGLGAWRTRGGSGGGSGAGAGGSGSGSGGAGDDYTTTGSGYYGGVAASSSSSGAGGGLTDTISSAATTGYTDFKSLMTDYGHSRKPNGTSIGSSASAAGGDSWAPDGFSSSADQAGDVNNDLIGTTAPSTGMTGQQRAAAGVGAAIEAPGAVMGIMGGVEEGGAKGFGGNMLIGAGMGASIGMMFGPVGALIGAGVGAVVGLGASTIGALMGVAGHTKARKYFHDELDPKIQSEVDGFRTGGGDFQSAISTINSTGAEGMDYAARHFGQSAANYMMSTYLRADLEKANMEIIHLAKAGSGGLKASTAQFHGGGYISDFGNMWTSDTEGYIHARVGESVLNPYATSMHAPYIDAMNSGASPAEMAMRYMAGIGPAGSTSRSSDDAGDTHYHIHTLDTKTMESWLRSGGAKLINGALNNYSAQYAGAGRS